MSLSDAFWSVIAGITPRGSRKSLGKLWQLLATVPIFSPQCWAAPFSFPIRSTSAASNRRLFSTVVGSGKHPGDHLWESSAFASASIAGVRRPGFCSRAQPRVRRYITRSGGAM